MTGNSVYPATPARSKINTSDTLLITLLFLHNSICIGVWPFTWSVILRRRNYPDQKTDNCIKKIKEEEPKRFSVIVCIAM